MESAPGLKTLKRPSHQSHMMSREELLSLEAEYFANLEKNVMRVRRTKIICTVTDRTLDYETLKMMYQSGMNILRLNMAYASYEEQAKLIENKSRIEKEFGCFIPLILDLKGTAIRVGRLHEPVMLHRGSEYRFCTDSSVIGDENIISIEDSDALEKLQPGDKLLMDKRRVEEVSESLKVLNENFPQKYANGLPKAPTSTPTTSHPPPEKSQSLDIRHNMDSTKSLEVGDEVNMMKGSLTDMKSSFGDIRGHIHDPNAAPSPYNERKKRYVEALLKEQSHRREPKCIVTKVDMDSLIFSRKPVFIQSKKKEEMLSHFERAQDEDEEEKTLLTARDIKDLHNALKMDVDCLAVSDVRCARDLIEVKNLLGNRKNDIKVLAKLQNQESITNYEEIMKVSDGIMISRNYLGMYLPVEKLYLKEKEIIEKCHEHFKPVIIVGQILDNMTTSPIPKFNEIHDIANLISAGADCLTLVGECTIGSYIKESIETLSRICMQVESKMRERVIGLDRNSRKSNIVITIAKCCIDSVRSLNASLIICFTQTGATALQLSKMRPICPILAIVKSETIARKVSFLSSVIALQYGSLYGMNELLERAIEVAKERGLIRQGEYVVATMGDIEGVSGSTNALRIIQV